MAQRLISRRQYLEWKAEYRLEPWGEFRDDLRIGQFAALYANSKRRKGKPSRATDFLLKFGDPTECRKIKMPSKEEIAKVGERHAKILADIKAKKKVAKKASPQRR